MEESEELCSKKDLSRLEIPMSGSKCARVNWLIDKLRELKSLGVPNEKFGFKKDEFQIDIMSTETSI